MRGLDPHSPGRKQAYGTARASRRLLVVLVLVVLVLCGLLGSLGAPVGLAAPRAEEIVIAVLGDRADGRVLAAAAEGARLAAARLSGPGLQVVVVVGSAGGAKADLSQALRALKRRKPVGIVAAPSGTQIEALWKAARATKAPIFLVTSVAPDWQSNRGNVWHLAPSLAAQAIQAADVALAPLAARRVAVVHEPTEAGRTLAGGFARNLSRHITLAGVLEWPDEPGAQVGGTLESFEADWIYAAVSGRYAASFVTSLKTLGTPVPCLFSDGNRSESLLEIAPDALEGSVFLDGPDPELEGRVGEAVISDLEDAGKPVDAAAVRAYEATLRLVSAWQTSGGARGAKLTPALEAGSGKAGALGALHYEAHRGIRFFPFSIWRARNGSFDLWPSEWLQTVGCGPPLGFGRPPLAELSEKKGKIGYLTFGDSERRTIEQDLLELGLSTNGKDPELDRTVRDEILGRAIRIAHQLFRREADGTPIPGWSWGMTFTTEDPPDDVPRSRIWLAFVAGDHPAAGGQVIGSGMVAIYSTFLKRTMYIARKLDPPLSVDDRVLLDGSYRWGEDRTLNFRGEKIRCLVDGFSSAVGLTLSHEFGHLCGCGHDTEHPTSIMNVVAGAGASWEAAVWIPTHQRSVTTTLGIENR